MPAVRLLIVAFVFFVILFVFRSTVVAQSHSPSVGQAKVLNDYPTPSPIPQAVNPYIEPNTESDVPKNLHTTTQNVMLELAAALSCQLAGIDPTNPNGKCLGFNSKTGKIGYVEEGKDAMTAMTGMIATMYQLPVRSSDYVNYLAGNFGFEKKAYAQEQKICNQAFGLGYCGIFPLINIWTTFRNMIYLLFVVIFMAIGLGIMLRVHIDPRTVMSIENQIPKIIIAIILATFSFAIAGFMVEIMYAVIFLIYSVFNSIPNVQLGTLSPQELQNASAIGIGNHLAGDNPAGLFAMTFTLASNVSGFVGDMLQINQSTTLGLFSTPERIISLIGSFFPTFELSKPNSPVDWVIDVFSISTAAIISNALPGQITILGTNIGGEAFKLLKFGGIHEALQSSLRIFIPFLIPYLVILIATIWALFRLWFALIQAYIFFLVSVVTAPFWMLMGLIPGSKLSFTGWFREIAADLSAFVVAITMLWLGKLFIDAFGCVPSLETTCVVDAEFFFFVPPLIGATPSGNVIGSLIGIGTLLSVPDALKLARSAFKPPDIDLKAAGHAVGVGGGFLNFPKLLGTAGSMYLGLSALGQTGVPGFGKFANKNQPLKGTSAPAARPQASAGRTEEGQT